MSARDADTGEPPAKRRAIDPIAPTVHPWNLPAGIPLLHCSSRPGWSWRRSPKRSSASPPLTMVEINESRSARDAYDGIASLQPHSTRYKLFPGDTIIGLGRQSREPFGLQANRGIYRKYCCPMISFVGCNLHNGRSSRWVNVPTSLHEGLDGILVEMASRELLSAGLQEKYLIIRCNGKRVTTRLQLFEVLVENIGQIVEVTIVKAENCNTQSIYLPVEEAVEKCFYH
uniref:PDZ domain-containing protein n=1 Tax=Oryza rufipogon TaxID=4529 RepID=A0A0E0NY51_ORYRU